jgi:hypothetical protein
MAGQRRRTPLRATAAPREPPLIEEDHACLDAFVGPPPRWLGRGRGPRPSGTAAEYQHGEPPKKEKGALI